MNRVILIKYGELSTKKGNIKFFINALYKSINDKLVKLDVNISKDTSRMYIEFNDKDLDIILDKINNIFGIHEYLVAYKVNSNQAEIENLVLEVMKKQSFNTFKVETKRSDKLFPISSMDFSKKLGGIILKNISNIKVDVHNPDVLITVEIRHNYTYIYTNSLKGLGGYPNGTLGKAMLMLSGGIDSPVAGYLTLKRGVKIDCVYFESLPHTSLEAREKVLNLAKKLSKYTDKINVHIIPFTEIQESIYKNVDPSYCITIMRRMMYRITERLAKRNKALIISNGESIGQVASQTLTSMSVINNVTNMPIIRPVACMDKLEIIDIAKKIDTYDISIQPFEDCCTLFVPKHPVINPNLDLCLEFEKKFDYLKMIDSSIENAINITIKDNNFEKKFEEYL